MDNKTQFRKSAKGSEAIAKRLYGLAPKQRSLLILIDGKRSVEDLAKMSAMFGDTMQLLAELEGGGFIEADTAAAPVAPGVPAMAAMPAVAAASSSVTAAAFAPPADSAPEAPAGKVSLAEAKRFAVRKLTDLMGPMADSLCMRLESARNVEEYNAMIARIESILRETRGMNVAAGFTLSLADHRPLGK